MSDDLTSNLAVALALPSEDPDFKILPEKFKCVVCSKLLRDPYQSICGHYFCSDHKNLKVCPIGDSDCMECESTKIPDEPFIKPDNALKRELGRLLVYCSFKSRGCKKEMQWKQLKVFKTIL